jgi:hypothetical protein
MHSSDHSTKGTPSPRMGGHTDGPRLQSGFDCLSVRGFRLSFIPLAGCFSPFPHGTRSLSVARSIAPWRVVPPASHRISRVQWYSGTRPRPRPPTVAYGALTRSGTPSQAFRLTSGHPRGQRAHARQLDRALQPRPASRRGRFGRAPHGWGAVPFRSPLLRESHVDASSSGY